MPWGTAKLCASASVVQQLPLQAAADDAAVIPAELVADRLLQALEIVEAHLLGERVVERGGDRLVDLLDLDREHGVLAGELGVAVVRGEGHVDRPLLAGLGADQLVLEAGNELARAELEPEVLGRCRPGTPCRRACRRNR